MKLQINKYIAISSPLTVSKPVVVGTCHWMDVAKSCINIILASTLIDCKAMYSESLDIIASSNLQHGSVVEC